jgi:dTMP kinase
VLVAFEGIDGSGKGTQAARLCERIQQSGKTATIIAFPQYQPNLFGQAIGRFLNGEFGAIDEVHPLLAAALYAADRYETRKKIVADIDAHDVVIFDRYSASNIAHQAAKLDGEEREELRAWITKVERDVFELPQLDLTILLDIPAEKAQELVLKKKPRDYTDQAADMHESDLEYLRTVRSTYQELAQSEHWQAVPVTNETGLRTIEQISEEIWKIVEPTLAK